LDPNHNHNVTENIKTEISNGDLSNNNLTNDEDNEKDKDKTNSNSENHMIKNNNLTDSNKDN
jgi:hypothetical protein